jgi:hypothetical protein
MTNGCTIPGENEEIGKAFEEYFPGWQKTMDGFTDFCHHTSSEYSHSHLLSRSNSVCEAIEERESLTLSLHKLAKPDAKVEVDDNASILQSTQPEPATNLPTADSTPSTEDMNVSTSTPADAIPKPAEPILIETGDDSWPFVMKEFGGQVYKYRAPHSGPKLSLQQLNDNARAFNKALAIATDVHVASKALQATSTVEKAVVKGARWGRCEEEGADPLLKENRRVTRAAAAAADPNSPSLPADNATEHTSPTTETNDSVDNALATGSPVAEDTGAIQSQCPSTLSLPTADEQAHAGSPPCNSVLNNEEAAKEGTAVNPEPAANADIGPQAIAPLATTPPCNSVLNDEEAAKEGTAVNPEPAANADIGPQAVAPLTTPTVAAAPPTVSSDKLNGILSPCDTNVVAAPAEKGKKTKATKGTRKRKTPEAQPLVDLAELPAKQKWVSKTNKWNL